jgi:hypothetical protein
VSLQVEIVAGDVVRFTTDAEYMNTGDATCVFVDYADITRVLRPGKCVYLSYIAEALSRQVLGAGLALNVLLRARVFRLGP